jgi:hypothetical protein
MTDKEIIFYTTEDNKNPVTVTLTDDTVWLTQKQIAVIFSGSQSTVSEHITNIFHENELDANITMRKFGISEKSTKPTNFYNLDVIIAVGYRVNSKRATQFRKWATSILKNYIIDGYVLNQKRLEQAGLHQLRDAVLMIEHFYKLNCV